MSKVVDGRIFQEAELAGAERGGEVLLPAVCEAGGDREFGQSCSWKCGSWDKSETKARGHRGFLLSWGRVMTAAPKGTGPGRRSSQGKEEERLPWGGGRRRRVAVKIICGAVVGE